MRLRRPCSPEGRRGAGRGPGRAWALALAAALGLAGRAAAQVAVTATLASDDRFRGRSLSAGRPTAGLDIAYDAANGAYAGLVVTGVAARHAGPQLLSVQEYAGFARRLAAGPSLDFGVSHANYTEYYAGERGAQYTELYAGLITRRLAAHLYYSPDYFGRHAASLYGEVDTALEPARGWRLLAHAGVLRTLDRPELGYGRSTQYEATRYDWRVGLATEVKAVQVELSWSGAGPDRDDYDRALRRRSGLALVLRRAF